MMFVGWMLLSSVVLTLAWNKVVVALSRAKKIQFWQTLLALAAVALLVAPFKLMKRQCCKQGSGHTCPYEAPAAK